MATVTGVRFKKAGKVYYFDPDRVWPQPGDLVVVETSRGIEIGETVTSARTVSDEQIVAPLKKVMRIATPEDIRQAERATELEAKAFEICQQKIAEHGLEMKLVEVEYTFDNTKIIFYFTANGRVDFRELVKDLASVFKMRIELRQIGVRDEAKMLGGLGACGRSICCGTFLSDFQPVSIKMAKEQNLSLNPAKISGQCGRLMCCLKYEQDFYESTLKRIPRVGKEIITPDGTGIITDINVLREKVKVRVRLEDDTYDVREYPIDDVARPSPNAAPTPHVDKKPDAPKPTSERPARRGARASEEAAADKPEPPQRRRPIRPKEKRSTEAYFSDTPPEKPSTPAPPERRDEPLTDPALLVVDDSDDTL